MIELTVCLPIFRGKYIAWVALESLCRQENIDFDWELIIAEEQFDEHLGLKEIDKYRGRLKKIRCKRLKYIPLKKWMPLSAKLVMMIDNRTEASKYYLDIGADNYSPPLRLKYQYDLLSKNKDIYWCAIGRNITYDIKTERTFLSLSDSLDTVRGDGTARAVRMDIMKNFNITHRKSGIDGAIFKFVRKFVEAQGKKFVPHLIFDDNIWMHGLNVHGLNNLTTGGYREKYFANKNRPSYIVDCPINIQDTIPPDIVKKLRKLKKFLGLHNRQNIRKYKVPKEFEK
jgi:hypothetical protein